MTEEITVAAVMSKQELKVVLIKLGQLQCQSVPEIVGLAEDRGAGSIGHELGEDLRHLLNTGVKLSSWRELVLEKFNRFPSELQLAFAEGMQDDDGFKLDDLGQLLALVSICSQVYYRVIEGQKKRVAGASLATLFTLLGLRDAPYTHEIKEAAETEIKKRLQLCRTEIDVQAFCVQDCTILVPEITAKLKQIWQGLSTDDLLSKAMNSHWWLERQAAAGLIGERKNTPPEVADRLLNTTKSDVAGHHARAGYIDGLVIRLQTEDLPALLALLDSSSNEIRFAAAQELHRRIESDEVNPTEITDAKMWQIAMTLKNYGGCVSSVSSRIADIVSGMRLVELLQLLKDGAGKYARVVQGELKKPARVALLKELYDEASD